MMDKRSKIKKLKEERQEAWECMPLSEDVLKKEWDNEYDEVWNDA